MLRPSGSHLPCQLSPTGVHQESKRLGSVCDGHMCPDAHSRYSRSCALLFRFLTYYPGRRINAEDGLKHEYFLETPLPIEPSMFPTWPAKSEQQRVKRGTSPRPPEGGLGYSQLVRDMANRGSHLGVWVGTVLMMATFLHRVMMT